jgi:hypothetical protein
MCHYYGNFGEGNRGRMPNGIFARLSDTDACDANLGIKCSQGVNVARWHTNCSLKSDQLLPFPVIGPDASIGFELAVTEPIPDKSPSWASS